jgi:MFS family permease
MVFSFGPAFMNQRGWELASASSVTSIFIIMTAISVPIGGILADRKGRKDTVIIVSMLSYTILMPVILYVPVGVVPVIFAVVGFFFGLGAGPIMTLASMILQPEARGAFSTRSIMG